ncbi:hypothetical protein FHS00_000005 [Limimaricola variabilis]|uniref:Uncharacterized protein n=1 Tax=Limimaricola variabilis TaxID=1492771 RepID=A0ABR6HIS6_9RHOB|nr:hypothetical protein [Limimaricola variabilis]MBB3710452.1 hypothetical protein [Limimaricola variabilis]
MTDDPSRDNDAIYLFADIGDITALFPEVAPLARSILRADADGLGLRPDFFPPARGDLEFLEETYPCHRSLRVFTELVRQLITENDRGMAHA